ADCIVNVRFVYYLTQFPKNYTGEKSAKTDFLLRVDEMVKPWAGFENDVREMLSLARSADQISDTDVLPNWSSCDAWGGCPHRAHCDKLTEESMAKQLAQLRKSKD